MNSYNNDRIPTQLSPHSPVVVSGDPFLEHLLNLKGIKEIRYPSTYGIEFDGNEFNFC